MTDLLHVLPDFPIGPYTHLIPSLEKHLVTTTDLLTLDAVDIARRAQLPLLDVRHLANQVVSLLQQQLGLNANSGQNTERNENGVKGEEVALTGLRPTGRELTEKWRTISTLDPELDRALGGGIPTGYITEITGESGAGKTQLLLTLLLAAQLPRPHGLSRPTLYISTEHPLPTTRVSQLLQNHPVLSAPSPTPASLSNILTLQTPDLESQDHILTFQLPVCLARHNIGLIVIDSIAANYRAETFSATSSTHPSLHQSSTALAQRSSDLIRTGRLLQSLSQQYSCAVVVANQVADRFNPIHPHPPSTRWNLHPYLPSDRRQQLSSSPAAPPSSTSSSLPNHSQPSPSPTILTFDHQQRFFTGWGDAPPSSHDPDLPTPASAPSTLKTPSLGLVWSNQIACRVALTKEPAYLSQFSSRYSAHEPTKSAEWAPSRWRRWMRVVFAPWVKGVGGGERGVEFEVWHGGVRGLGGGGKDDGMSRAKGEGEKERGEKEEEEQEEEEEEEKEEEG